MAYVLPSRSADRAGVQEVRGDLLSSAGYGQVRRISSGSNFRNLREAIPQL
jgi:hypothetical protein